ncbi:tRNA (5-methylaminomethyl-2-thiouridylate)-methyltransferase [Candidatus Zinderia insecticola CARI]|uniref:tRNA-uridine 2-sulfurtransferase n=1 Tax=Zinderia insecticola (strain CARI) TaxID=871271 RepID=E0TJ18_ZINIC|nr:tRNA (5-methylaminomethyl-2-thiouridylate)-methyltransferase [Candidatus Zinderia insecticola CARI]
MKKKIILAMSGGIDSSITAWLLKKKGYKVIGIFMKNWHFNNNSIFDSNCKEFLDALKISEYLKIKIKILDFSKKYRKFIFNKFLKEYKKNNIPNPDILCNSIIKFKFFLNYCIKKFKIKLIATGHYLRIKKYKNKFFLLKALDKKKDQSYFLYSLNKKNISNIIFPLGDLNKKDIRRIAKKIKFFNYNKKDSIGICFIGKNKIIKFLSYYIIFNPGYIKLLNEKKINKHLGINFYNIGQRKGLKIGGIKNNKKNKPWYVIFKDIKNNIIYISNKNNNFLKIKKIYIKKINFILNKKLSNKILYNCKIKHGKKISFCKIKNITPKIIYIKFLNLQKNINNGQSIIIYYKEFCLFGGIIKSFFFKKC